MSFFDLQHNWNSDTMEYLIVQLCCKNKPGLKKQIIVHVCGSIFFLPISSPLEIHAILAYFTFGSRGGPINFTNWHLSPQLWWNIFTWYSPSLWLLNSTWFNFPNNKPVNACWGNHNTVRQRLEEDCTKNTQQIIKALLDRQTHKL